MVENENTKFDEVVTDIIKAIADLSYEDKEKEILRAEILLNFYKMHANYPTYLNAISVLRRDDEQSKSTAYSKTF